MTSQWLTVVRGGGGGGGNGDAATQKGETKVLIQKCSLKDNPGNKEAIDNCIQAITICL